MSIKSKVLSVAATLTLVGGIGTAGALSAGTANAATPSCGPNCVNIFSQQFGTHRSPNYTVDVLRQGEKTGQPIILFRTANFDPALDWSVAFQGQVSTFATALLVGTGVSLHYGGGCAYQVPTGVVGSYNCVAYFPNDPAFEIEYAPFGVDSGLCMGLAATAFNDEGVTLQPCGVSSKTVWIADTYDSPSTLYKGYVPLINGSNTNFSQPFVLSYPNDGFPTDKPRPQLVVLNITGSQQCPTFTKYGHTISICGPQIGTVQNNQLWGATTGVLP
jgi:hypothetical protein